MASPNLIQEVKKRSGWSIFGGAGHCCFVLHQLAVA